MKPITTVVELPPNDLKLKPREERLREAAQKAEEQAARTHPNAGIKQTYPLEGK